MRPWPQRDRDDPVRRRPQPVRRAHAPRRHTAGVVVVIHGGFWKAAYDLSLGRPLAADLVEKGWAALNIEYRRVGRHRGGGGVPSTLDDVRAAIATLDGRDLDLTRVVTLGHSAGGHLAAWAGHAVDAVTHVISQAGVLDLVAADRDGLGGGAVRGAPRPPGRPGRRRGGPAPAAAPRRTGLVRARHRRRHRADQPVAGVRRGRHRCRRAGRAGRDGRRPLRRHRPRPRRPGGGPLEILDGIG